MRLEIERDDLLDCLSLAGSVVKSKTPKTAWQSAKLVATEYLVTSTATDGEVWVSRKAPATVEKPGECLLPVQRALAAVRECDGTLSVEATDGKVTIHHSRGRFSFQTENPAEFGSPTEFEGVRFSVDGEAFQTALNRVSFACDVAATRFALGGVLFEFGDGLTLVATDSRRLAVCELNADGKDTVSAVVPQRVCQLVSKSIDGPATILVGDSLIQFELDHTTVIARQVDGRFPQWKTVLPSGFAHELDLIAKPFSDVVRPASLFLNEETRGVDFAVSGGLLKLASQLAEVGDSEVELVVPEGIEFGITLDPRFVLDFLKVLEPETPVKWGVLDSESATLFWTEDGYRYVVMPLSRDR